MSKTVNNTKANLELIRIQWRAKMLQTNYEWFCQIAKELKYKEKELGPGLIPCIST